MSAKDIVMEWLNANGYGGLCTEDCGCELEDLMPCSGYGSPEMCEPGYRKDCKTCKDRDPEQEACANGNDFCIRSNL